MKITYTYYLFICITLCSIFASCNNDTDIYMENPDKRIQNKMQEYTDILAEAPDGWIAEINTQLGGIHTLWMQFTADNRVTMMFDYVEYYRELKSSSFESSYILKALQTPTLSFDTYSFLSIFADPNQLMNGAGQAGTGLGADYEYEIISYKNDQFVLKGKKNKMDATLTKATHDEKEAIMKGALMENQDQAPIYQNKYFTFSYKGESYDFVSNGRKTGFLSAYNGTPDLQVEGSKIDLNGNIIMMSPLVLDGYEIYQFNKTPNGYSTQVGNDVLEIKGGSTPIVPLYGTPPGVLHQTLVVFNDMQNQWSSEYFDKHKAAVSNLFEFTRTQYYIVYVAIHMYIDGSIVEIGYRMYQGGQLGPDTYGFYYSFEYEKNTDGSIRFGDYTPFDTSNPNYEEFDKCLSPILNDYLKGHKFFIKSWPVLYNNNSEYVMSALIPAEDRTLGVMVGVPMSF